MRNLKTTFYKDADGRFRETGTTVNAQRAKEQDMASSPDRQAAAYLAGLESLAEVERINNPALSKAQAMARILNRPVAVSMYKRYVAAQDSARKER